MREDIIANRPSGQGTGSDLLGLGRACVDVGMTLAQVNKVDEADKYFQRGEEVYHSIGSNEALTARLASLCSFRAMCLAVRQEKAKAMTLARHGCAQLEKALCATNPLSLQTQFCAAIVAFTTGDFPEAVKCHEEVLERRICALGTNHQLTLASRYCTAVAYQTVGNLEKAEYVSQILRLENKSQMLSALHRSYLRETLTHSLLTIQWREEDVARTKFRLSIILHKQNRPSEAARFRAEALEICHRLVQPLLHSLGSTPGDEDNMTPFDAGVTLWHGRTTGIWGNGRLY